MKKYIYCLLLSFILLSCSSSDDSINAPSKVSNITAAPIVGGAMLKWQIPSDSSFTYLEVHYMKNKKEVIEKVSKYTDSVMIVGLINKEPLKFEVRTVNETSDKRKEGQPLTTDVITPIKRQPDLSYFPNELTKLDVDATMLDTYTQETNEGPKENLVDGDPATYWHTAYSSGVAPLPHWIQLNFEESKKLGTIMFWFRQNSGDVAGRPSQWGLEISDDGQNWERVWESQPNLPVTETEVEHTLTFDKNYESQYFRVMILQNGGPTYTHLGEISFYTIGEKVVDKELEAEEEYYRY
jgi:hypothetical protein